MRQLDIGGTKEMKTAKTGGPRCTGDLGRDDQTSGLNVSKDECGKVKEQPKMWKTPNHHGRKTTVSAIGDRASEEWRNGER